MTKIFAAGLGLQTFNAKGEVIATRYPKAFIRKDTNADKVDDFVNIFTEWFSYKGGNITIPFKDLNFDDLLHKFKDHEGTVKFLKMTCSAHTRVVVTLLETDEAPNDVNEAFLKLTLISNLNILPHGQNIDGIFGTLQNLAWTNEGPIDLDEIDDRLLAADVTGRPLHIHSVDKFPQMLNFVVPKGVRICDAARVRLGAHISPGTTVMHEGFINFNAGTLGKSMVEGRISAGVVIGDGTDIGGGASIMGILSGGNKEVLTLGENILLGANSGTGISLGNNCTIEAGLYLTAGTKVLLENGETVKASTLSKKPNLLFRRNSKNGAVQALENLNTIVLNEELHSND
jgi:2,3,4,5-tetrahydropyridine-2-carboxylate N-succinyltransferase